MIRCFRREFRFQPRGFAPRTPLQPHSLALGRSLRSAGSFAALTRPSTIRCFQLRVSFSTEGLRPSDSPTASLARAGALAPFRWLVRGAHSPLDNPVLPVASFVFNRGASPLG